jgi:hypothetical protein
MFDLVNKYRTPVMWVCVLLMAGFGLVFMVSDLFAQQGQVEEKELAKFTLPGGGEKAITNYDLQRAIDAARKMGMLDAGSRGQGDKTPGLARSLDIQTEDPVEAVYAFLVLTAAAKANGYETTDAAVVAELNEGMKRNAQGAAPQTIDVDEWRKNRPEEIRAFWRDLSIASRFRATLRPVEDAGYAKLFEKYKTDYEELRAEYVFFDGAATEVKLDPRASAEDRAALEKWWSEEAQRGVRAAKMIPEQGDFEVLYVRFKDLDDAAFSGLWDTTWGPLAATSAISVADADVEARFNNYRDAYDGAVAAGRKAAEEKKLPPPASDFEAAKERVKRELTVVKLFEAAHKAVTAGVAAPTFEQAAGLYGAKPAPLTKADATKVIEQSDFGSAQAQEALFGGFAAGTLKKGDVLNFQNDAYAAAKGPVDDPAKSVSIWRVLERRESREPTLDDDKILDYAVEKFLEKKKQDEAKRLADEFKKAVDDKVAAALKDKEAELEAASKKAVDEEIAKQGLSRDKAEDRVKIVQIENQQRIKKNEGLDAAKAEKEPEAFRSVAAEKGATVRDSGFIRKTSVRQAFFRPDDVKLPTEEKAARFFRKQPRLNALAALKKGRVGAVENEPQLAAAGVMMLVDRREPTADGLWSLGDAQMSQLRRAVNPATPPTVNYDTLKNPAWFGLAAPDLEASREAAAKQKATEEESNRKKAEREKAADQRRAATLVEGNRDATSPIKSGEDW